MTTPGQLPAGEDRGHLLPQDVWERVQEDAERHAQRIAAGHAPHEAPVLEDEPGRRTTGVAIPLSGVVHADSHGGRRSGVPTFGVLHSAETPLRAGYAGSLSRNWFGPGGGAPTSCHYFTDPAETWGVLPDELVAYHVGGANPRSIGVEQAGYARLTRAEWLSPEGLAQLRRNAALMRAMRDRYGIGLFWNTDQQLRDAHAGRYVAGWSTHDQCRRVIGGTSHTDPGTGFPYDVQMKLTQGEGLDVALTDEDKKWLRENVGWSAYFTATAGPQKGQKVLAGVALRDGYQRQQAMQAADVALAGQVTALRASVAGLQTAVAGLATAVKGQQPLDVQALLAQVDATVRDALEEATVQVSVDVVQGDEPDQPVQLGAPMDVDPSS